MTTGIRGRSPSLPALVGAAIRAAARHWPLALALYLPTLALALLATLPALFGALALAPLGWPSTQLAQGRAFSVLVDVLVGRVAAVGPMAPALDAALTALIAALLALLVAVLLQGLAYTFLSGGLLARLAGQPGGFWAACRAQFWAMLRFGLLAVPLYALCAVLGLVVLVFVPGGSEGDLFWKFLALLCWLGLVDALLETARASVVVRGDGRAAAGIGRTVALLGRPRLAPLAFALWLLLALLGLGFWVAGALIVAALPIPVLPLAVPAQQALALAGAWLALLRLAVVVGLARTVSAPRLAAVTPPAAADANTSPVARP